ncbi:myosin XVB [Motacilla alba alba]|uniref:myosin XVB n=1 Tax=Motacilla alba alba TaxID=1094192 RepID=UPI0018D5000D|nr:myosin XVB [Motacilla alba alba]
MPPSRPKTQQKNAGKEKVLNCERNSTGDSKICCGKRREGNSCSDSSSEGHGTHRTGTKEAVVGSTSCSEEKSSSSEERSSSPELDGNSKKEVVLKDPPVGEEKGYKELADESKEASIEPEKELVTTGGKTESEAEGTEFAGLEAEEKMRKPDNTLRQPECAPAESSEADDQLSTSGLQVKSVKNRENIEIDKENILENDRVEDMSKDGHMNSDNSGESSTAENIDEVKENKPEPLPTAVKAELHVHLCKYEQEEKVNDEDRELKDGSFHSKQQRTLKEKPGKCENPEQGEEAGDRQRHSSDCSRQDLPALMLPKKCSSRSHIPLSLENQHKNAETKLPPSQKPNSAQMALGASSDLNNVESICSKAMTLETPSKQREPNTAQSFGEKRLNTSSCSTITKKSSDKQPHGKKKKVGKVIGKVKQSSGQSTKAKKEKAEEVVAEAPSETEPVHGGEGSKHLHTCSAFRKVTSWLGQKPAKKARLKARLLSVARAIGISRWLLKKFGKKKSSKPFGFRNRMAIRILSTAGWVARSGKAFPGAAGQLERADPRDKESSASLVEGKGGPNMVEEVGHLDLSPGDPPLHGTSSFPCSDENNSATDAKFAVVFPRVHSLVKAKNSLSKGFGNGHSLEKLKTPSERKSVPPVQQACRFKCDLPRPLLDPSQRKSKQGFFPHREEEPLHTSASCSEVDTKEGSGVLQTAGSMVTPSVHWSQQQGQGWDPAAWLNSELLLPRPTMENLSKWAISKEPQLASSRVRVCKDQWEADDAADNVLEMEFMQKEVYMCEEHYAEVEEVEDLTRLEEVSESSVLQCLKKRFHRNLIYTYIGQILISVNPFKDLRIYSEDVATEYQQGTLSKNAPHIFAIAEMAYTLSQSSGQEQCVLISGHSGSGKTEAAKAIVQYLTMLYQESDSHRIRQPCSVLPILESFGNARTILNDNSSRFGKLLNVHLRHGIVVGTSISQYLLEKSRVVFQGRACEVLGKEDSQDFLVLVRALEGISLSDDQLNSTWAVLAAILQLGNICFTSYEKESFEHAAIASETEIQIVANLLRVSAELLQRAVTHRVTVTSYDRIFTPLSVEAAIDARDSIAKALYYLLFEWLLLRINEWLAPWESDCAVGIVDIHGFEDLGVNSLEQLCINFANEHLQWFFSQTVIAQEEEEYSQEQLAWIPISKMCSESCLDFLTAKPHGILCILDDQTSLTQATDHTFLQKCHYHHGNSPWYIKPKLPLPEFTVQHYAGPVTYQVHKFLNKNRDQLRPEVLDIFSQSRLKVVSQIFQRVKAAYGQRRELGGRGRGLRPQASTLVSKFQQSLQDLTAKLRGSHAFFIRCITPNPRKLSNVFDVEYVNCQLRHSGILEAIHILKEGFPVRLPFQSFLARYGLLAGSRPSSLEQREGCAAVLAHVVGTPSDLYQIGVTKRKFRRLLQRRRLRVLQEKVTLIQAHFRGYQARKRYMRLKKTLVQFKTMFIISRPLIQRRKRCQDVGLLDIPAELAALLHFVEGRHQAQANQITETQPPEVKVKDDLSLPPTINSHPFSSFIRSHFQKPDFPAPGQPLQHPLTHLDAEHQESALEINKLILRFIGDQSLRGWQEVLLGNYIAGRGLSDAALRNEIFSQVVTQTWRNPDTERSQRGWVLMATLLSCFGPSPALEKPLLKFVSDYGMEGYSAVCQRKMLTAAQCTETEPAPSRAYPPTQLEWTANQRRGKMVLDVHTFNEEKFSAEVESWMTGEQYAAWILSARGCDKNTRGWSISMFTGHTWQDLLGCDFVLDLIGEMEETSNFVSSSWAPTEYPITPERGRSILQSSDLDMIPPAPGIQAPAFPPPSLPPELIGLHPDPRFRDDLRIPVGLDHYVDDLFSPVLHQSSRVSDIENRENLTRRMKGGGKIGPTQRGIFPSTGFPGMTQTPVYQPMPSMMGMPAAMPMMPGVGGVAPMPAMVMPQPVAPAVDPSQLAAQQQAFINQQAMLMAQQMTLQAMSISQQQQQQELQKQQKSLENSRPRVSSPAQASAPATLPKPKKPPSSQAAATPSRSPEPPAKAKEPDYDYMEEEFSSGEDDDCPRETFQQKKEYFQKLGEQHIRVKKVRPSKTWTPPAKPQPTEEEEEEKREELEKRKKEELEKRKEEKPVPKPEPAPASPLPPEPKPKKETPKPKKEQPVVKPSGPEKRPAPSHEIGNIIKMYQSRPAPEPQPFQPTRVSKPFIKKNDPKNEALAKLGMMNPSPQRSPSPVPQEKKTPPPVKPKPGPASSSIKEKQLPLLSIFKPEGAPPAAQAPDAPPLPPPTPEDQGRQEPTGKDSAVTMAGDDGIKTQLYKLTTSVSFSYVDPAWKFFLRKEVFYPKENFSHPYCLNLLCEQIIRDTFSESSFRISREEKRKMKDLLMEFRVGNTAQSIQEDGIKKRIVVAARDNWANYFSRLFPVQGEKGSDVQLLGVSHRGMRLLKMEKAATYHPEHLKILRSYCFADVLSVEMKGSNSLEFSLKTEQLILHSPKAPCIKAMVELFMQELRQDTNYVVALRSYIVDDKSLLSFNKGDLIELLPMQGVEPGWQFGSTGGRCGLFPTSLVQLAPAIDYLSSSMDRRGEQRKSTRAPPESRNTSRESSVLSLTPEATSTMLVPAGDHYTMIDFATAYFREAQSMQGLKGTSAEKKNVAELVQHTKVPIQASLLRYSDSELNELATKNFQTLMRFMGDHPKHKQQAEVQCIYEILQLCKEKENLHDEIYCQVIKQVTHNPQQGSELRGWLLLNLLTGYFLPSKILMPYATKFLQLASSDPSSTHHDIAKICQSNLRKNFLYGGRRHLPFPVEMEALLKGHSARRLVVLMPGGMEYLTRIRTFTVAKELLQEICEQMGIGEQQETQDFVLFAIRSDDKNLGKMVRPIKLEEYLHDYLLEDKLVTVTLRRLIWRTPLHFDNQVYTDVHYGQVLWDYLNGRILLNQNKEMEMQVGLLAMLQHWAKVEQQNSAPSREELKEYIPKSLQASISPKALHSIVATLLRSRQPLQPRDAKIQFIEHVMKLPFFDYTIFIVERISDDTIPVPCFFGVNKEEIIVVDGTTQVCQTIPPISVTYERTGPEQESNTLLFVPVLWEFQGCILHTPPCAPHTLSFPQDLEVTCGENQMVSLWGLLLRVAGGFSLWQVVSRVIPLKELQKMRTLRPISDGGLPGLELHYGSPGSPRALWLELSQAKELYHTIVVILDKTELHS